MAEATASGVKRKLLAGRGAAPGTGAGRAFAQALARGAHELFGLPLRVRAQSETLRSLAELPELLEDHALLTLLDGPGEAVGLCALGSGALSALIETQMTGRLAPAPPPARRPTRTDAAMLSTFVEAAMIALTDELASSAELTWAGGFHYASCLEDPRPLPFLLEDGAFKVLRLDLALGADAAREGTILLALPAEGRGAAPAPAPGHDDAAGWSARLERAVLAVPVTAVAVLGRVRVTAEGMLDLRPGMLLPLAADCVGQVSLEVSGDGCVARGRLGRYRGQRALRIAELTAGEAPEPAPSVVPIYPLVQGPGASLARVRPVVPPKDGAEQPSPAERQAPEREAAPALRRAAASG